MARLFDDAATEYLEYTGQVIGDYPLTVSAWAYFDDVAATHGVVGLGHPTSYTEYIYLSMFGGQAGDPVWYGLQSGGPQTSAKTSSGVTVNTWHHVCGRSGALNDHAAFIDGGSKGTSTTTVAFPAHTHSAIGILPYKDGYLHKMSGRVGEVAIWNVALSDAEIALLAKGLCPLLIQPQNIVGYWPLVRDDNAHKGAYHMTPFNSPTWADHPPILYPSVQSVVVPVAAAAGNPWYSYAQQ